MSRINLRDRSYGLFNDRPLSFKSEHFYCIEDINPASLANFVVMISDIPVNITHQKEVNGFVNTLRRLSVTFYIPIVDRFDFADDLAIDAGLFANLTDRGIFIGFSSIDVSLRQLPTAFGAGLDKHNFSRVAILAVCNASCRNQFPSFHFLFSSQWVFRPRVLPLRPVLL